MWGDSFTESTLLRILLGREVCHPSVRSCASRSDANRNLRRDANPSHENIFNGGVRRLSMLRSVTEICAAAQRFLATQVATMISTLSTRLMACRLCAFKEFIGNREKKLCIAAESKDRGVSAGVTRGGGYYYRCGSLTPSRSRISAGVKCTQKLVGWTTMRSCHYFFLCCVWHISYLRSSCRGQYK
ncbi:hypothetical protein BDD12DRAFT_3781 [Trichophaea hybrida]|nr:hypothetical protein BDD12DRAFT_3781 [Trichophaea hybrida]